VPGTVLSNLCGSPVLPQRSGEVGTAIFLFAVDSDAQRCRDVVPGTPTVRDRYRVEPRPCDC